MHLLKKNTPSRSALTSRHGLFFVFFIISIMIGTTSLATAASLEWNANDEADYYIVYWRTAGDAEPIGNTDPIPAGTNSIPLYESSGGTEYTYTVKAFNTCGNTSDFSQEITTTLSPYEGDSSAVEEPAATYAIDIILPEEGMLVESGVLTDFSANVTINETLASYNNVVWISGIDGQIGTGSDICVGLSAGIHTIMASLTDDQGGTVADTMTLTVLQSNAAPVVQITQAVRGDVSADGQSFTLTGSASDEEDGDLSESIVWLSDVDGGLGKGSTLVATLTSGSHVITAKVEDANGQDSETSLTVTAETWNNPPTLTLNSSTGGEVSSQGEQAFILSGTAQDAEDGNLSSSIIWASNVDGDLGTGSTLTATLSSGTHTITASITDSQGKSAEAQLTVVADQYNYPPEINMSATPDGTLGPDGQAYILSGSANDTEDGDISASITWSSNIEGPLGTGALVATVLISGEHTLTAHIGDSQGKEAEIRKTVTVNSYNFSPELTITTTATGDLGPEGQAFSLAGTAQDTEDGDLSQAIVWTSDIGGSLGTGASLMVTLAPGTHTVTASVTDSQGSQTDIQKIIQVNTYNNAPSLSVTTTPNGPLGPEGMAYLLSGTAEDTEDGDISAAIEWSSDTAGTIGTGASIETTLGAGTHIIVASATDSSGEETRIQKTITVETYNYAPQLSITVSASGDLGPDGQAFLLTGSATDTEDGNLSAAIAWSSDTSGNLGAGASLETTLGAGTHTITATVTDSKGETTNIQKTVTVAAYNYAPQLSINVSVTGVLGPDGKTVLMTGTATDTEDGVLSSAIVWVSSLDGALGTGATIEKTLGSGTHIITATVTDSQGRQTSVQQTVTVDEYNYAPEISIASSSSGSVGEEGQTVLLTGTAVDNEDGNLSSTIVWSSTLDGDLGTGANLTITLSVGTHTITATVTDSNGEVTEIQKTISIEALNNSPTISISTTLSGDLGVDGQPYTLTGTANDAEDGDLSASIVWKSDLDGTLGTGSGVNVTLSSGTHTITASVTDSYGQTVVEQRVLTVASYNQAPTLAITSAVEGVLTSQGQAFTLSATASDNEDGDLSASIVWESDLDGALGTGSAVNVTLSSGTHTITASVTDSQGKTAADQQALNIDSYNNAPEINITTASAGALASQGQPYTFSATAYDSEDGDLSESIVWTSSIAGTIGSGETLTVTLTSGIHVIRAQVTDSGGKSAFATREIPVESFDFTPTVTILNTSEGEQDGTGQTFAFTASANDTEDGNLSGSISWVSQLQGRLGTGTSIQVHLVPGDHTITAQVEDSFGNVAQDDVLVTSVALDYPPTLTSIQAEGGNATRDGQLFTFSCSANDHEDGDLSASLTWFSSVQGELGTGAVVQAVIPLGQHTITVRVTDSHGQSTESTKDITAFWVNQDPVVHIRSTETGASGKEGQVFMFTGDAIDEEDGDLSADIIWTSSLIGEFGQSAEVMVTLSEGTHTITAQISDTDGGHSQASTSVTVSPYNAPPVIEISSVIAKESDEQGQSFAFSGSATDEEDGDISGSIVWSSDLDGVIGTGPAILTKLSDGEHSVTVTATDSQGRQSSQSLMVVSKADTGILIDVSSHSFYYFKIVTITWSGATTNVDILKNDKPIGSGGPEGSKYFWFSGSGRYKVCEQHGGECSEEITIR